MHVYVYVCVCVCVCVHLVYTYMHAECGLNITDKTVHEGEEIFRKVCITIMYVHVSTN